MGTLPLAFRFGICARLDKGKGGFWRDNVQVQDPEFRHQAASEKVASG